MKPYPHKCRSCARKAVVPARIPYAAELEHDGRLYPIQIASLEVLRCQDCGAIVLTDAANKRITEALRAEAGLLAPEQIRQQREDLGLTTGELAACLGEDEDTVARWEAGVQVQQRAQDRLLQAFFALPELRHYLGLREQRMLSNPSH
jgi:putative zinc finger/helix-turn-helix YgiT family protein